MTDFERNKARVTAEYEALINRKNIVSDSYNGIYDRYVYPVLTAAHAPIIWKYDMNPETNPYFMERLGINAVLNSGAIYLNGKYYLVARVEGNDRKSFFAVAESDSPVDGFRFWDFPVQLPDTEPEETNVYDMRLTQHEDGWIYGVFCSESTELSFVKTVTCIFTTLHQTQDFTLRQQRSTSLWITHSTLRQTRCVLLTA